MPKHAATLSDKLNGFVKKYGDVFSTDGRVLRCKLCDSTVNAVQKSHVEQHTKSAKHAGLAAKSACKKASGTPLLANCWGTLTKQEEFNMDLCEAFVCSGIPLWKLENPSLKGFLAKYTQQTAPSESTLRKNYVDKIYAKTIARIRESVGDKCIWISVDETPDVTGRCVANAVIGTMQADGPSDIFLLASECLDRTNSTTIAQFFTNALLVLWPDGIKHDRVLLFLTDGASYMKKAGKALSVLFPCMLHLTCLAHAFHNVAEEIRRLFPDVDLLVSNGKKVFLKAPNRVHKFREVAPDLSLPPQPVLTRWGTWLAAAIYYAKNFQQLVEIMAEFEDQDAASIRITKELLAKPSLSSDLVYISAHFSKIPAAIEQLETQGLTLSNSLQVVDSLIAVVDSAPGSKGVAVADKCDRVLSKNQDLKKVRIISKVIDGEDSDISMAPDIVARYKFAPVTSADTERSFSLLKYLLSERRQSLKFENLRKLLVVKGNSKIFVRQ
jgi:hypothetical protein